jgi:hypothetical protein
MVPTARAIKHRVNLALSYDTPPINPDPNPDPDRDPVERDRASLIQTRMKERFTSQKRLAIAYRPDPNSPNKLRKNPPNPYIALW